MRSVELCLATAIARLQVGRALLFVVGKAGLGEEHLGARIALDGIELTIFVVATPLLTTQFALLQAAVDEGAVDDVALGAEFLLSGVGEVVGGTCKPVGPFIKFHPQQPANKLKLMRIDQAFNYIKVT
ncbi:hypothetical protein KC887_04645 [Candidatus Kaiserbacteria bacterium]|nr:hypothetical protein [Candidatus Kaiserbacteria bacterium]